MGTVSAPHRSPTAPKQREWDWDGTDKLDRIREHGGWEAVANAHAWYDPKADDNDPPHEKGAYKLPHHELIDGELRVVWRGVVAAMTVVNEAASASRRAICAVSTTTLPRTTASSTRSRPTSAADPDLELLAAEAHK